MFLCECGREFTTKSGFSYHKKFCGNYEIFLDSGYEAKTGSDGRWFYIHRDVMEKKLGRKLKPGEVVHHIDENKRNNDPENLSLTDGSSHTKNHFPNGPGRNCKLTEEQVIQIKQKLKAGEPSVNLIKEFNSKRSTISSIKTGDSWKHIQI